MNKREVQHHMATVTPYHGVYCPGTKSASLYTWAYTDLIEDEFGFRPIDGTFNVWITREFAVTTPALEHGERYPKLRLRPAIVADEGGVGKHTIAHIVRTKTKPRALVELISDERLVDYFDAEPGTAMYVWPL